MNVINEMLNLPFLTRKKRKHHLKNCSKKVPNPSSFLDDSNDSTAESVQSSGTVNGSEKSISSCSGSSVISISSSTTKVSVSSKESISNEELLYGNTLNISVDSMPVII